MQRSFSGGKIRDSVGPRTKLGFSRLDAGVLSVSVTEVGRRLGYMAVS